MRRYTLRCMITIVPVCVAVLLAVAPHISWRTKERVCAKCGLLLRTAEIKAGPLSLGTWRTGTEPTPVCMLVGHGLPRHQHCPFTVRVEQHDVDGRVTISGVLSLDNIKSVALANLSLNALETLETEWPSMRKSIRDGIMLCQDDEAARLRASLLIRYCEDPRSLAPDVLRDHWERPPPRLAREILRRLDSTRDIE